MFKKYTNIVAMTAAELSSELLNLKKNLMMLRFQAKLGDAVDNSMYHKIKKSIARVLTEVSARRRAAIVLRNK